MPLPNLIWREPTTLPKRGSGVMKPVFTISACFLLGSAGLLWAFGGTGEPPDATPTLASIAPVTSLPAPDEAKPAGAADRQLAAAPSAPQPVEAAAMPPLPPARPADLDESKAALGKSEPSPEAPSPSTQTAAKPSLDQPEDAEAPPREVAILDPTQWSAVPTRVTKDDNVALEPPPIQPAKLAARPLVATLPTGKGSGRTRGLHQDTPSVAAAASERPPPAWEAAKLPRVAQASSRPVAILDFESPELPKPRATEPRVVRPEATQPVVTRPEVPEIADVEPAKPQIDRPRIDKPGAADTSAAQAQPIEPGIAEPQPSKPQVAQPQPVKPEVAKPDQAETESAGVQGPGPLKGTAEIAELDASKPDVASAPVPLPDVAAAAPEDGAARVPPSEGPAPTSVGADVDATQAPGPAQPSGRSVPAPYESAARADESSPSQLRRERMVEMARRNKAAAAKRQKQRETAASRRERQRAIVAAIRRQREREVYVYEVAPPTEQYYYYPERRRSVFIDSFM